MRHGLRITLFALALCLSSPAIRPVCLGQDQPPPITLQKITIPDGRIEDIPGELLPVERSYVQETLQELNRKYRAISARTQPQITHARYFAKLENRQLVGRAELEVKHLYDETARLELVPMAVAATQFAWKSEPNKAALVGRHADGLVGVRVAASDTLTFQWSLNGSSGPEEQDQFDLSLPNATTTDLELTLPSNIVPNCANAIITEVRSGRSQNRDTGRLKTWRLEFGSISETELSIERVHAESKSRSTTIADSHTDYRLHPTGMELLSTHQLHFYGQVPRELTINIDASLQLGDVKLGERKLKVSTVDPSSAERRTLSVRIPDSVLSGLHDLSITAYSPIITDELWQLPTIQVEDIAWRRGTASLQVVDPLEIHQLDWPHTILRSLEPLPSPSRGEIRSFALIQRDTPCKVFIAQPPQHLIAQSVTSVKLDESNATSHFAAKIKSSSGDLFSIDLQSGPGWIVDAVETVPDVIEKIDPIQGTNRAVRRVTLHKPIARDAALTLIVKSHRRLPTAGPLKGEGMRPIQLLNRSNGSNLTAVRAEQPLQLDIFGDAAITRVTEPTQTETDLLDTTDASLLYRDSPNADRLSVVTRRIPPRYNATVDIEASIQANEIAQQLVFRCVPLSSRVGSLRVRFSPQPTGKIVWSTVGDGSSTLSATQVSSSRDEWEVHLRRTRSVPFEIRAVISQATSAPKASDTDATESIVLASLPDAESQSGSISIGTNDATNFSIDEHGLRSIPPLEIQSTTLPSARARFRYAPAQESAIHVTRHAMPSTAQDAWIWKSEVTSHIDVSGDISHTLRLRVENVGLERIQMQLPANVAVEYVDVNGERVITSQVQTNVSIPLAPTDRFHFVDILCTTTQNPLGTYTRRTLNLPTFDLRIVANSWKVLVPPGYDSALDELGWRLGQKHSSTTPPLNWEKRLFGYEVVRKAGVPWNPLSNLDSNSNRPLLDQLKQPDLSLGPASAGGDDDEDLKVAGTQPFSDWSTIHFPPTQTSANVLLYRRDMANTLGWALLFVTVAIGLWLGQRSNMSLCVAIAATIVFVLVLPAGFVFLVRSALFGLMLATAFRFLAYPSRTSDIEVSKEDSMSFRLTQRSESVTATAIFILVTHLAVTSSPVAAQETTATDNSKQPAVFNLYDPVNEEGDAVGRDVYISPQLFELFESLKMRLASRRAEALITNATYSLPFDNPTMATLLPTVSVVFELSTLSPGMTTIDLPFRRNETQVLEASFDDQRIYPRWNSNGDVLQTDVELRGSHTLRVKLRPIVSRETGTASVDFQIPEISDAQLTLSGFDTSLTEVPSAIGSITRTETSLTAMLGPTDRLQITWPTSNASSNIPSSYAVSQQTWVHAEAELATVESQLALTVLSGNLDSIDLQIDRRLKFLPSPSDSAILDSGDTEGTAYTLRYPLDRTYEQGELVTVRLNFLIPNVSHLDNFQGALIRLDHQPTESSQLAISRAPGIAAELSGNEEWSVVATEDFTQAWGGSRQPEQAFSLPSDGSNWSLKVTPLSPQVSSRDTTRIVIGRQTAELKYYSELQVSNASISQITLDAPAELSVDHIVVTQKGLQTIHDRFAQTPDGAITVFLNNQISGDIGLALEGSLIVPTPGKFDYEGIRIQNANTKQHELTVIRRPEVLVKLPRNQSAAEQQNDESYLDSSKADRIVGMMNLIDEGQDSLRQVSMEVARNPSRCSAQLMTTVVSQSPHWSVTADLSLKVEQGVVDSLRIRLPSEMVDSLKLDPPLPFTVQNVPGQSEPTITVIPPSAIDKSLRLKMTADLAANSDGSISAPSIELLDATVDRYLSLPKRSKDQEIDWDIRGLEMPQSSDSHTTYRVRNRRMAAVVREVKQAAGSPHLLLTDVEVRLQSISNYSGIASFDLVLGALKTCNLILPSDVELIHVTVDDVPALLRRDNNAVTIELQAERLPQRIAVLFTGKLTRVKTRPNAVSFAAPTLRGLEPQSTLWSIRDAANDTPLLPLLNHAIVDEDSIYRLRASVIDEALTHAEGPASQLRMIDIAPWKSRWEQRRRAINEILESDNLTPPVETSSLQSGFAARDTGNEQALWTHCSFKGSTPQLTVVPQTSQIGDLTQRVGLAISICLCGWLCTLLVRLQTIRDAITRWPYVPGVVAGIIWWLWLTPSFVGWLIVAVFIVGALRPAWHARPAG